MKKYLAPDVEFLALAADVIMASGESGSGSSIADSENETAKDYIADLVIGDVENI